MEFETAVGQLKSIIEDMERDNKQTLNETVDKYKEGLELVAYCNDLLKKAEQQIVIYDSMFSDEGDVVTE